MITLLLFKNNFVFVAVVAICVGMVVGDCPVHCTLDYTPVCGEDADGNQQTYGNMCGYESEACKDPSKFSFWNIYTCFLSNVCILSFIGLRLVKHEKC